MFRIKKREVYQQYNIAMINITIFIIKVITVKQVSGWKGFLYAEFLFIKAITL
jgi:hypothetical protein